LRGGGNYIHCIQSEIGNNIKGIEIAFVLVNRAEEKPRIKMFLDDLGLPSQFLLLRNIRSKLGTMGVITNILRQVNAKSARDLYKIATSNTININHTMVVGVDVIHAGKNSIVGMAATNSGSLTQHYTKISYQDLRKNVAEAKTAGLKDLQEEETTQQRIGILSQFMKEAFQNYTKNNNGQAPG